MFVVAARTQQPGPPPAVVAGRPVWLNATTKPVGIQHAAAPRGDGEAPRLARCDATITDWISFAHLPFDLGAAASCRRCTQLLSAAEPQPEV